MDQKQINLVDELFIRLMQINQWFFSYFQPMDQWYFSSQNYIYPQVTNFLFTD